LNCRPDSNDVARPFRTGFVLPVALSSHGTVIYGRHYPDRTDGRCRAVSADAGSGTPTAVVEFSTYAPLFPLEDSATSWANYVIGVVREYLRAFPDASLSLDLAVAGNVPLGGGLSSSASLEVTTASLLETVLPAPEGGWNVKDRALRCKAAENEFCGVPCGIMDQYISSAALANHALLISCESNSYIPKSMPPTSDAVLVICNSGVKHDIGGGEYPVRVRQCADALAALRRLKPGLRNLRAVSLDDVEEAAAEGILDPLTWCRVRHVVTENARTARAAAGLAAGDLETVGQLMGESHVSLRDDYEVSCKEVDALVEAAGGFEGVYGSRMTGGGFGGCTVTLVRSERAEALVEYLREKYQEDFEIDCQPFITSAGEGAKCLLVEKK